MKTFWEDEIPEKYLNRSAQPYEYQKWLKDGDSICGNCERATRGRCPWAQDGRPYPGWTAKQTGVSVHYQKDPITSYVVHACPGYVPTWELIEIRFRNPKKQPLKLMVRCIKQKPERWQETGVENFCVALMEAARIDYITVPSQRSKISAWLGTLLFIDNPAAIRKDWHDQARIFDLHPERKQQLILGLSDEEWERMQAEKKSKHPASRWIVYNSGTPDAFAECEHCGHEREITRKSKHLRFCPACKAHMRQTVNAEDVTEEETTEDG